MASDGEESAMANVTFSEMRRVFTGKSVSVAVRKGVLKCYIEHVLVYAYGAWPMKK